MKKKRILIAAFKHETNSFCPAPANREAFENRQMYFGEDVKAQLGHVENEIGAFYQVLGGEEDMELVPCFALNAAPSGPVTADVYDLATKLLCDSVLQQGPFDGILLSLHGAMVAEGHPDGEGDLLEALRRLAGPNVPIVASLDLHANVTEKMAKSATALLPYECYPHVDTYRTGRAAAALMGKILRGQAAPVMAYRRVPYLLPLFPSDFPEIRPLYALADSYKKLPSVLEARFTHGFFPADIEEMGMSALIITDGDRALAERLADDLAGAISQAKDTLRRSYPTLDDALDAVLEPGDGPVVLADASDNPGGGGMSDTTHLLRRVLERGITGGVFVSITDPESVAQCEKAGVGATIRLALGGKSDPRFSGGPIDTEVKIRRLTDGLYRNVDEMDRGVLVKMGHCAVVEVGGNLVVLSSIRTQPYDLEALRSSGITPEAQRFLAVKSSVHYRASYGRVARKMIDVALPGYQVPIPDGLPFRNWKEPTDM